MFTSRMRLCTSHFFCDPTELARDTESQIMLPILLPCCLNLIRCAGGPGSSGEPRVTAPDEERPCLPIEMWNED